MDSELKKTIEELDVVEGSNTIQEWMDTAIDVGLEGVTNKFALWLSDKLGGGEKTQYTIYFLTTVAVLETGEKVFNIGSGITSLNTTAFTLHSIKKKIEKIEKKVNVILDTPLKLAFDYSQSAVRKIIHKSYKSAQETLKNVLVEAKRAFYYSVAKKSNIDNFKDRMTAVQIIIFGTILSESYNEEENCFLPYAMLDEEKKKIIGGELEDWIKNSFEEKSKINTKTFFVTDSEKENTLQDCLDGVLKISYPFISESKKLTSMHNKISSTEEQIKIKVLPSLLPVGEEDCSVLPICKRTYQDGSSSSMKIQIWRTKSEVHCKYINGPLQYCFKSTLEFNFKNDVLNYMTIMTLDIPEYTSEKTRIEPSEKTIDIRVWPKFVPVGEEDMIEMIIGVRTNEDGTSSLIKVNIWRNESEIYCLYGSCFKNTKKFMSENEVITMTISIPLMIVITEDGTITRGECLGLYSFDQEHGCYKQVATEENHYPSQIKSRFVYLASDEAWYISDKPGKPEGWMYNTSESRTLPLTGWMVWDRPPKKISKRKIKKSFAVMLRDSKKGSNVPSVKIQFGPLTSDQECRNIEIHFSSRKWLTYGGLFTKTNNFFCGKPVFINDYGQKLHSTDDGDWGIGPMIGLVFIKSESAGLCPAKIKKWSACIGTSGELFHPIDSAIVCSKHLNSHEEEYRQYLI